MATLPSGLPDSVADDENLARFLTSASQFNAKGAKPSAYLPSEVYRNTSVFRHGEQPKAELLNIWTQNSQPGRNLHAIATCKARDVRAARLDVLADEPPPRHANIEGWPWNDADPDMAKAARKELAAVIAQSAEVIPP
jgi:hypothetical protein